jgi:hypothetical protein
MAFSMTDTNARNASSTLAKMAVVTTGPQASGVLELRVFDVALKAPIRRAWLPELLRCQSDVIGTPFRFEASLTLTSVVEATGGHQSLYPEPILTLPWREPLSLQWLQV